MTTKADLIVQTINFFIKEQILLKNQLLNPTLDEVTKAKFQAQLKLTEHRIELEQIEMVLL